MLLGAAAMAAPAAATEVRWPAEVLKIGTPGDYAPYAWFDPASGTYLGSDISMARALAQRLGLTPEFVQTSWSTLVADAAAGRFDIAVGGISITAERQRVVEFSKPYATDRKQPVVRCGEERRFDTQEEINRQPVRLVVNPGGTNERFSREHFPAATLTVHADNRTVFEEIRSGRADVMVTDSVEGRLQQRTLQGLCVAPVRARWAPASKAILVAAGAVTRQDVDGALASLGPGRIRNQMREWEGYNWSAQDSAATRLAALIDDRLGVVVDVARAKWNLQAAIEDPARERESLLALRGRAAATGIPAEVVGAFFGAQIRAAKILQQELFTQWRKRRQPPFAYVKDLTRDIRPEIDRINAQMLATLALHSGSNSRLPAASTFSLASPAALKAARAGLSAKTGN